MPTGLQELLASCGARGQWSSTAGGNRWRLRPDRITTERWRGETSAQTWGIVPAPQNASARFASDGRARTNMRVDKFRRMAASTCVGAVQASPINSRTRDCCI